jgi:hypothetical protein
MLELICIGCDPIYFFKNKKLGHLVIFEWPERGGEW